MSNNTGGTAFPKITQDERWKTFQSTDGMTLRDYFAAKAMQGLLSEALKNTNTAAIAQECYAMADAMLKAREASNGS